MVKIFKAFWTLRPAKVMPTETRMGLEGRSLSWSLRPTKNVRGYLGQLQKSCKLFHQSPTVYKKNFPKNLT